MANIVAPNGPFWPLGRITVATPGTPVPITQNLNAKGLTYAPTGTSEYAAAFHSFMISAPAANTLNCYLMYPGFTKADPNGIILTLIPGQVYTLSASPTSRNVFSLVDFTVDADTASNYLQITGFVAN